MDSNIYLGGSHYYEFSAAGGDYPPGLLVLFSGPSIPFRPVLGIQSVGSAVIFSWSTIYAGFILESADLPAAQTWAVVTNQPISGDGRNRVSFESAETSRFFRLHRP